MHNKNYVLKVIVLFSLIILTPYSVQAQTQAVDDQNRIARDLIRVLEAYAVYKMGQYDLAFERYTALAEDGNRQGMLNVANMYLEGKGVKQSDTNAFKLYLKLAESGDRMGMEQTATAYRLGRGVQKDLGQAQYWEAQTKTQN
ncbi:tetratricopeptide repeat protein [Marinobacter sp.]|uniref:tetratricopeptide repeat protein n=1 Tax=Marinobacter sp. TaxID=50741 RepID=UPI003A957764